jgi:hypothetical protein
MRKAGRGIVLKRNEPADLMEKRENWTKGLRPKPAYRPGHGLHPTKGFKPPIAGGSGSGGDRAQDRLYQAPLFVCQFPMARHCCPQRRIEQLLFRGFQPQKCL